MEHPLCLQGGAAPAGDRVAAASSSSGKELTEGAERLLLEVKASDPYEYVLLVTNADWDLAGLAQLYRERRTAKTRLTNSNGNGAGADL